MNSNAYKMVRSLVLIVIITLSSFSSQGQVLISLLLGDKLNNGKIEFGLDGGANFPDIRGLQGGSAKANFNLGFYFDIKLKNPNWMVHTGVLVKSSLGTADLPVYLLNNASLDSAFVNGEVKRKINYFNVPLMMKYKINKRFFVEGGIMPSLRAKAYDIFTTSINSKDDLEHKVDIKDQFHRLDFGLIGGAGYRLLGGNGMNLGFRYYYGLVDILVDDSKPNQYNQSFYLYVGIPIGAGKDKEKKEK